MTDAHHDVLGSFAIDDPTTARYWAAAAGGGLLLQRCRRCDAVQFYPRPFCLSCHQADPDDFLASGVGTVYSRVIVRITVLPGLEPPYAVGLIDLAEGPRILANLVRPEIEIGTSVQLTWRSQAGIPVPWFDEQGVRHSSAPESSVSG